MAVTLRTPMHFAEKGHEVTFLVHSETTSEPAPLTDIHKNIAVVRFELPMRFIGRISSLRRPRQCVLFALACLKHVFLHCRGKKSPDVIYAAEADAVLIGRFLASWYRVPLVTRFYVFSRINASFDRKSKSLRKIGFRHLMSRLALQQRADLIIVTDDGSNGQEVVKSLNPHTSNIKCWQNGIDRASVVPEQLQMLRQRCRLAEDDFVLLTVCRLDPMKRVDRAIRALRHLHDRGRCRAKLLIAGDGPLRDDLQILVSELGLVDAVTFLGNVPHGEVYNLYALCRVFLSLYDLSNVGNPLLESLNAGCCVVTLDVGGTGYVIGDGENGRLLAVEDDEEAMAESVACVLEGLILDPTARATLANGAKKYADENFWTWPERLQAELHAILDLVVDRANKTI